MLCWLTTTAMLVLLCAHLYDRRQARRRRASNKRVLREFRRMTQLHPEQIVSPRRDLRRPPTYQKDNQ